MDTYIATLPPIQYKTIQDSNLSSFDATVQQHLAEGWQLYGNPTQWVPRSGGVLFKQTMIKRGPPVRAVLERVAQYVFRNDTHARDAIATMSDIELLNQIDGHPSLQNFGAIMDE